MVVERNEQLVAAKCLLIPLHSCINVLNGDAYVGQCAWISHNKSPFFSWFCSLQDTERLFTAIAQGWHPFVLDIRHRASAVGRCRR